MKKIALLMVLMIVLIPLSCLAVSGVDGSTVCGGGGASSGSGGSASSGSGGGGGGAARADFSPRFRQMPNLMRAQAKSMFR